MQETPWEDRKVRLRIQGMVTWLINSPEYPEMEMHNSQLESQTPQEQDPETHPGESLDVPDVHPDPDIGQQPTQQSDPKGHPKHKKITLAGPMR